jgi:hypothetical protein
MADELTIRDKFAMAALQGIIASGQFSAEYAGALSGALSKAAYDIADAMLDRRPEEPTK